ncbi:MAG TPA: hypothetical protein VK563_14970 [Puia sp.]|nr:hypothetical protein [Puia sp.]
MRNALVQLALVLIGVTGVHAVKLLQTASLHARVFPAGATEKVWAIQGSDSIEMFGSEGDYYITTLKPGNWQIRVDARRPYKDADFGIFNMRAGTERDLGEVVLRK